MSFGSDCRRLTLLFLLLFLLFTSRHLLSACASSKASTKLRNIGETYARDLTTRSTAIHGDPHGLCIYLAFATSWVSMIDT